MTFQEYMQLKKNQDRYEESIAPYCENIALLRQQRDEEMRAIDLKYSNLINQQLAAIDNNCVAKPYDYAHDISVIIESSNCYDSCFVTETHCFCLLCGNEVRPNDLTASPIRIGKVVHTSEISGILNSMRTKLDDLFAKNPELSLKEVRETLVSFINEQLFPGQSRG